MRSVLRDHRGPRIPFGRAVQRRKDSGAPNLDPLSVYLDAGVVPRSTRDDNHNRLGADLSGYLVVEPGDIVFNRLRTWQGGLGVSRHRGIVSPAYFVCRPRADFEARFLHYLLRSSPYLAEFTRISKFMPPSQFDILWDDLRLVPVPVRALAEQRAIAHFLDTETARIDALIAKKRRMIDLLKERWLSTLDVEISPESLQRGADIATALPPGWQVRKLFHLLDPKVPLVYGILLPGPRLTEGVPYIGAGDVRIDRLTLGALPRTTPEIAATYPRSRVRAGELVYAIRGTFGAVEVVPDELDGANLSRDAARIAPGPDVCAAWLMFALKSHVAQEQFRRLEVGAMVTGVNIGDLKAVRLPLPPPAEQKEIAARLAAHQARHHEVLLRLPRQIALLQEHRQALITAAVTGELEVPGVAA